MGQDLKESHLVWSENWVKGIDATSNHNLNHETR